MAKFALPIRSTYVPKWGPWEALRELIQNAKDEEDERGNEMLVTHDGSHLSITNRGADMDRSVLLLGKTSKDGRDDLRGQFGEGLNLALLAGVRSGLEIVIYTCTERWSASIEPSNEYGGEECLVVQTRKLPKRRDGVEVVIKVSEEEWEGIRRRLLFLNRIADNKIVRTDNGAILLEEERRGHVYVKGIFTAKLDKLYYGYDLDRCDLDRDRRMVDIWDLQWRLSNMYADAVRRRPELLGPQVYRMLRDNAEDVKHFKYHATTSHAEGLLKHFQEEHGETAVPVGSIGESQTLDRVGRKGVVVPETLREVLQKTTGTAEEIQQEMMRDVVATYSWTDLEDKERALLTWATSTIDDVSADLRKDMGPLMSRLEVVDFRTPDFRGTERNTLVRVARRLLSDREGLLATLVHEEAHAVTGGDDGSDCHVGAIEEIWQRLYFSRPKAD